MAKSKTLGRRNKSKKKVKPRPLRSMRAKTPPPPREVSSSSHDDEDRDDDEDDAWSLEHSPGSGSPEEFSPAPEPMEGITVEAPVSNGSPENGAVEAPGVNDFLALKVLPLYVGASTLSLVIEEYKQSNYGSVFRALKVSVFRSDSGTGPTLPPSSS